MREPKARAYVVLSKINEYMKGYTEVLCIKLSEKWTGKKPISYRKRWSACASSSVRSGMFIDRAYTTQRRSTYHTT